MNEPFERQPNPVVVTLSGDPEDVLYWKRVLMRRAEFKGDLVQGLGAGMFKIYPGAVND